MVASFTGQSNKSNRTNPRGGPDSGSDFVTSKFSHSKKILSFPMWNAMRVVVISRLFDRQAMAYKEAKPQTFVRIIVLPTARVM
ncbi:hypothetical protein [Pseudocitrobacter cyperus]|uniref:Uncharacterized protein n=1 Tax=Pseudocitrobacter cyperus TaxID=3112843 RepID=A0ABV0HF12_9ENTR